MASTPFLSVTLLLLIIVTNACAFSSSSSGRGFGASSSSSSNSNFVSPFDRFKSSCPADIDAIRKFDPSLLTKDNNDENDIWVAVYRSANNLPSVFVRDEFFAAMKSSTTAQGGDSETLVSTTSSATSSSSVILNSNNKQPVAVARLGKDAKTGYYIIDSMRCILKKEGKDGKTSEDCDGGTEHTEAIGVCIDELIIQYLQRYSEKEGNGDVDDMLSFDGGIHFRGTLVSGKLLDSRGFREVNELTADMHSHESDFDGALAKYAERSTSREVAKNPGARDRALKIVSYLGRINREEDRMRDKRVEGGGNKGDEGEEEESDFDPWASVKKFI